MIIAKIKERIDCYGSFKNIDFAIKEIKNIIQWSWVSKDIGIIDIETHQDIYGYAIDTIINLEHRKELNK